MYSTVHEQTCQLSTPDCLDRILRASWLGAKKLSEAVPAPQCGTVRYSG